MSHVAEQFSWVPLPYCSLSGHPFPMNSLALSAHVSPWSIHFRVLDKGLVSGPGRGHPSCNNFRNRKRISHCIWALHLFLCSFSFFLFFFLSSFFFLFFILWKLPAFCPTLQFYGPFRMETDCCLKFNVCFYLNYHL